MQSPFETPRSESSSLWLRSDRVAELIVDHPDLESEKTMGLVSFCKTIGGKGLRIVTPPEAAGIDRSVAKAFARAVCKVMAAAPPSPRGRLGKV